MNNEAIIDEFRASQGKLGGMFAGMNLLLITVTGAKSHKEYTIPVAYTMDKDTIIIVASKGGSDTSPDWYYNLKANPRARVELGSESFEVEATEADEPERVRLYAQHADQYPGFIEYQEKTTRKIPVFVLKKV